MSIIEWLKSWMNQATAGHLACLPFLSVYWITDTIDARFLPWWRRGAPSILMTSAWVLGVQHEDLGIALTLTSFFFAIWNMFTARRNRRDGNDVRAAEEQAALTEVQETAFRREAKASA